MSAKSFYATNLTAMPIHIQADVATEAKMENKVMKADLSMGLGAMRDG